jgi:hypothetical protein
MVNNGAASFSERVPGTVQPSDEEHREDNYDICRAIDLTRLGVVLDRMIAKGRIHPKQSECLYNSAAMLRLLILTELNRAHNL